MSEQKWITVKEFAKLVKKSKAQIYFDIRVGNIPPERVKKEKTVEVLKILVDEEM